ncbi:TlpA family protein disulfide reductase [Pseudoalteromonas sp. B160]|uniref:TlpA family protein disulfide reductase n=1 Tax=Pseudoalteromonas sp. B160 TaxID=630414 RepID=UPI00301BCBD5
MLKQVVMIGFLLLCSVSFAAQEPLVGQISAANLLKNYNGFEQQYDSFKPSQHELNTIKKLAGKDILVLFGTWCHDSEREVPRLLKLIKQSQLTLKSLKLVAVGFDKRDDKGIAKAHQLKYTATIIVKEGDIELARMIEKPKHSLAVDLTQFN